MTQHPENELAALKPREVKLLEFLAQNIGADLFNYGDAIDGRVLEKRGLIDIGPAHGRRRSGAERLPYYGASINEKGRDWLARSGILQRGTGVA